MKRWFSPQIGSDLNFSIGYIERLKALAIPLILCFATMLFLISSSIASGSADRFIEKAHQLSRSGDIDSAIVVIQEVIKQYPNNAEAWGSLGIFKGMKASKATDYTEAGQLIYEAFNYLDKAVEIDSTLARPRLWRGILGVKVPEFMGRLEQGIADLELVIEKFRSNPNQENKESALQAFDLLIEVYRNKGQKQKALDYAEELEKISGDSEIKKKAHAIAAELRQETSKAEMATSPGDISASSDSLLANALQLIDDGRLREAEEILKKIVTTDKLNARVYKELARTMMLQMQQGIYDERIHQDTNWAANRAFELVEILDEAIVISPDDLELRLMRGIMGIQLPFFVNRLDQGIEDLELVLASRAPAEIKSQAELYLGYGYQKKGMKYWRNLINKYPDSPIAQMAFEAISTPVKRVDLSSIGRPSVIIDFVIAFKDELPPQTALWIETDKGEYVRTVYVSGFSGYAKDAQVVLPNWASRSNFIDADATTSASIDLGEHCYVWDLSDHTGKGVDKGNYIVNLEVNFWPSGKYEHLKLPIPIGGKDESFVTREGKLVPYLEVKYLH